MRFDKYRFMHDTNNNWYLAEFITWILCGTEGVAIDDPRGAAIGEVRNNPITNISGFDLWIPLIITNPAIDMSGVDHVYNTVSQLEINSSTHIAAMTSKKTSVATYTQMDIYGQPLLPGYLEVNQVAYNANVTPSLL